MRTAALLLAVAAILSGCSRGEPARRTIEVGMRYSRFQPEALTVQPGRTVEFVIRNEDPIEHEFILGTEAEQRAHELGDPHDPHTGPGQALVGPGETKRISFTFPQAGSIVYACHRPGHYAYGMRGSIRVAA